MENDWIDRRVDEAQQDSAVADSVATEIKNQLNGKLSERALTAGELKALAEALLELSEDAITDEASE